MLNHAAGLESMLGAGGRVTSIALVPSPTVSPGASSVGDSIRLPFTHVPFSDCRSSSTKRSVDDANDTVTAGDLGIGDD